MKYVIGKRVFGLMVLSVLLFSACNTEDLKFYEDEKSKTYTQDISIEVQRIKSVGKLIEGCARQPEFAQRLIDQHKAYSIFDGRFIQDEDTRLVAARVEAFQSLMEYIARQPEAAADLNQNFDDYAGKLTPAMIATADETVFYRNIALGSFFTAFGRNIDAGDLLYQKVTACLGVFADYEIVTLSTPSAIDSRAYMLSCLIDAMARNPEASESMMEKAVLLTGTFAGYPLDDITTDLALARRIQLAGVALTGISRQPDAAQTIKDAVNLLAGDKSHFVNNGSCLVNAARMSVLKNISENSARVPDYFFENDDCIGDTCGMYKDYYPDETGGLNSDMNSGRCTLTDISMRY